MTKVERSSGDDEESSEEKNNHETSNLTGDYLNVAILLLLYLLQGIPLGISGAIPIFLQTRKITYAEQAIFTFAFYPFTMKILWAPIVDSVYVKAFGRRKSWLIPMQLMIGAFMIFLSLNLDNWLGDEESKRPQMLVLTSAFFILWFLTATQDVAVDGWALTMLQRRNVGHAATCAAVGQSAGGFIGFTVFMVLESKDFANKYIFSEPQNTGLITLSGFLQFWGIVFLGTTILIAIFKKENSDSQKELENHHDYGIKKAYPMLWKIIKLKPIMKLALLLLTVKISFAAVDAITTLKLVDYGLPKEKIAILSIPLMPFQFVLPFIISRFTTGPTPMTFYVKSFAYRLIMTIVIAAFVYFTPQMIKDGKDIPNYFYVTIVTIYLIYQVPMLTMFVAEMAFMAKISDPLIGASYMTLLTTLSNLGGRTVKTFFLWFVDIITWKSCIQTENAHSNSTFIFIENKCNNVTARGECFKNGGFCQTEIDGYYIEVVLNFIFGIFWYHFGRKIVKGLEKLPMSDYHVLSKTPSELATREVTPL